MLTKSSQTNDMQMAEIRQRKVPSRRRRDGLIRFAKDNTIQNGEDGVIARLLELLPPSRQDYQGQSIRHCVDVGAWDGKHLSNTYSLLVDNQQQREAFHGVLIEADPVRFVQLEELCSCKETTPQKNLVKMVR